MKAIPAALAALTLIAMPVLAGCTATTTPATSPALTTVPDRWYVQSAHSPGSSMLSIAFDRADAERIAADLHARGYRARVVRERVTREIIET